MLIDRQRTHHQRAAPIPSRKKHLRGAGDAQSNRCACLYLVDLRRRQTPRRPKVFPIASTSAALFRIRPIFSAAGIAHIAALWARHRGGAYVGRRCRTRPSFVRNQERSSRRAAARDGATGEVVSVRSLGRAEVHARRSGVARPLTRPIHHALPTSAASSANSRPQRADLSCRAPREPVCEPTGA